MFQHRPILLNGSSTVLHQPKVIHLALLTTKATCSDFSHISLQNGAVRKTKSQHVGHRRQMGSKLRRLRCVHLPTGWS